MNKHPSPENTRDATPVDRKAKPKAAERTCIMVLGMHRSGTSALTGAIGLLGAELPKNMLGANPTNPAGHWEPARLIELHDQMLTEAGSSWDDWRSFDQADLGAPRLRFYKAEIARLIDEEYGSAPVFVLKEPRISRFVPLYAEVLKRMRVDVRYVLTERNPLAVVASLEKRGSFTHGFSALLWLRHELEAEYATRDYPRVFLSYETMLDDWRPGVERMTAALQIKWPQPIADAETALSTHFSVAHQHHVASRERLEADPRTTRWVKDTYSALMILERDPNDAGAMARLDTIRDAFNSVSPVFGEAFFPEMRVRTGMTAEKYSQIVHLAETQAGEIDRRMEELESLRREMVEKDASLARQQDALQHLTDAQLARIEALTADREARERDAGAREIELMAEVDRLAQIVGEAEGQSQFLTQELEGLRASQEKILRERDQALSAKQHVLEELEAVYTSYVWRMASMFRRKTKSKSAQ
ncbi:hypothetical protein NKI20_13315 [Mesorhizobium sp. M0830]|uniref:sulfotransferase family protein n=1 Tax=Mesorhizobium sp. M0830 TaxID=2957008 RepID=UPI003336C016